MYPFEQLPGAIKLRAQELGAEIRAESPRERARRAQGVVDFENGTRALFRSVEGVTRAREQAMVLCQLLDAEIADAAQDLKIEIRRVRRVESSIAWSTDIAGVNAGFHSTMNMVNDDSFFQVNFYKHAIVLPGEGLVYMDPDMPHLYRENRYRVARSRGFGFCWRSSDDSVLSSSVLAEKILNDYWSVYEESAMRGR